MRLEITFSPQPTREIETSSTPSGQAGDRDSTAKIFTNRFGHIRAGWRILAFLAAYYVLKTLVKAFLNLFTASSLDADIGSTSFLLANVRVDAVMLLVSFGLLKWLDRRPLGMLGLSFSPGWFKEFCTGLVLAFGLMTVQFLIFLSAGLVDVTPHPLTLQVITYMALYSVVFCLAAIWEELLFRGYMFQAFIEGTRSWIAVLTFGALFSSFHFLNPNFHIGAAFNAFAGGVLVGVLYVRTRALWMPLGLHLAWNWTQSALWGMTVSGETIGHTPFTSTMQGPKLLSGGAFGPEGSVISTLLLMGLVFYTWTSKRFRPSENNAALWRGYPAGYGLDPSVTESDPSTSATDGN